MKRNTEGHRLELAEPKTDTAAIVAPRPSAASDEAMRIVRRRWSVIAVIALLAGLAGWLLASMQPGRYRATTVAAITPMMDKLPLGEQVRGIEALDQRTIVATAAALASTPEMMHALLAKQGIRGDDQYDIRAVPLPNTNLLRIDVEDADAARATAIANRVPAVVGAQTHAIFKFFDVTIVSPATNSEQVFPRPERAMAAGLAGGLLLGFVVAWMLEKRRTA